jgi:hypothetical protein
MGVTMDAEPAYTGTHKVVLPADYLNSIEAAIDLHAEQIASVAVNLDCAGLQISASQRAFRRGLLGLAIWLAPVGWITCL